MARHPRRPRMPREPQANTVAARPGPAPLQLGIVAVIAVVAIGALILFGNAGQPAPPPPASAAGIRVSGNAMGEAGAPVTIEEWGDFQCPACRAFAVTTEPQLRTTYVAAGTVRFVFHHLAFIGQESTWAAEAAECAGEEGRFFDFHDTLYALQSGENIGTFTKANLQKIAHDLGLSTGFDACLASDRYGQRVRDDTKAGQAKGVTATPTFFVNGRKLEGVLSIDQLRTIIDPLIK
jgi:protein-disulfide isomerase